MLLSHSRILAEPICTTIFDQNLETPVIYFFYLHIIIWQKWMVLFYCSFFCAKPLDQKLESSMIYFLHVYTTIWPKYRVLFHLLFLLFTTIWPKTRVHIDLFLLFAHNHSTKYMVLFYLFYLCVRPSDQNLGSSLNYFFYTRTLDQS